MSINEKRFAFQHAKQAAELIQQRVKEITGYEIFIAGSIRREKKTIGDVDFVVKESWLPSVKRAIEIIQINFLDEEIKIFCTKASKYKKMSHAIMKVNGEPLKLEFYAAKENGWIPMIVFATGSGDFNIMQRRKAIAKGYMLSQHGLFVRATNEQLETLSEVQLFEHLGMKYLTPQERENVR